MALLIVLLVLALLFGVGGVFAHGLFVVAAVALAVAGVLYLLGARR